jgi:hypothetical protein
MQKITASKFTKLAKVSIGLGACGTVLVTAYAAVTFDPSTGIGFVGKGDLQTPWGWNDAKLQSSAAGVSFYYHSSVSSLYSAVCTWTTGEGKKGETIHNVAHNREVVNVVSSSVACELRKNGNDSKVTGFNLLGCTSQSSTVDANVAPVVGQPCMGNEGHDGLWTSVTLVSSTSTPGGLYASSAAAPTGASPLLLWSAPN